MILLKFRCNISNIIVHKLLHKKCLVTAGPTYEPIDPVRYIGNYASGKMGFALAEVLAEIGCSVFLVTGPTHLTLSHKSIQRYDVTTCDEMYQKCMSFYPDMDIAILAAAVSDYKPEQYATQKIKKKEKDMDIRLVKTKDIAYELGLIKTGSQLNIGFALESENELDNARKKRMDKNFDLIVLNSIRDKGAGFNYDTNKISVINNQNKIEHFELKNKKDVARDIISKICELL